MSIDAEPEARPKSRHRADQADLKPWARRLGPWAVLLALAGGFVFLGAGNLDLGPIEAKLGLSASEWTVGPLGQVCGGWEPSVWPAQIAPSVVWARGEVRFPTAASVRWPSAIAGVLIGLMLARRQSEALGARSGVLFGLCWFGGVALIDRSAGSGIDLIAGFAILASLDRILNRGSDLIAGLWLSLAFLAGGWPPVAVVALATVVIGRIGSSLSARLLVPPFLTAVVWSGWALSKAPAEAWGAALALPLTQKSAWLMALGTLALGLPWSPFAALAASRAVREGWSESGRSLVLGWLQVAGASLLAGTVVPGLASAARMPALAGLAVASAACLDRLWSGLGADSSRLAIKALLGQTCAFGATLVLAGAGYWLSMVPHSGGRWIVPALLALPTTALLVWSLTKSGARHAFFSLTFQVAAIWIVAALAGGLYVGSVFPYYRTLAVVLIVLTAPLGALAVQAIRKTDPVRAIAAVALVAICLKMGHWGYYVPEWNYRRSQGPWGRAIGQWVLPRWPIYTVHAWPPDLAFAIGRPVRQLADPRLLRYQSKIVPKFVLLFENELEYWPKDAPPLITVATFEVENGPPRVLARTEGDASWRGLARASREE